MRLDQTNKRTHTSTSNARNPAQAASARQTRLKPIPPSTSHDATTNPHPSTWPGGIHDADNARTTALAKRVYNHQQGTCRGRILRQALQKSKLRSQKSTALHPAIRRHGHLKRKMQHGAPNLQAAIGQNATILQPPPLTE